MFHRDTLCDTTPAVINFLNSLSAASESPCNGNGAQDGHHASPCMPVMGHIFLTSLRCVSRLARKRQLLLKHLQQPSRLPRESAAPSSQDAAVQSSSVAAEAAGNTVFVRLVLSLLGHALVRPEATAPCTSAPNGGASPRAAPLPWWAVDSAPSESTEDVVYDIQCVLDEDPQCDANVGLSEKHAPGVGSTPLTVRTPARYRIILRSNPVAICSPVMMSDLAPSAEQCDGGGPGTGSGESAGTGAVAGSCVARTLEMFDTCVRQHEGACLRQIAEVVGSLQQFLEKSTKEVQSSGERSSTDLPADTVNDDAPPLGGCASPLHEWIIDVPVYGVTLCIEDTHATRLEHVRRLTTPLLQAATGCGDTAGGPLGGVTQVLSKLHVWCSASAAGSFISSGSTGAVSQTPALGTVARTHVMALRQLVESHLKNLQTVTAAPPLSSSPAAMCHDASQTLAAPACIVHCQLGVSRSPSVVMLFYMDVLAPYLRAASSAAEAPLDIYHGLLKALVQARRQVRPNVCFSAQLLSLWRRLMKLDTPASPMPVM